MKHNINLDEDLNFETFASQTNTQTDSTKMEESLSESYLKDFNDASLLEEVKND